MPLTPLPVDEHIAAIVHAVRRHRRVVVIAPPGAGKTTRIPPSLVDDGPVILLQPRRVAARLIARRIAEEQGWTLGEEVGWQVRFERRYSRQTRLLVVTEGILTARLQTDPLLSQFRTAILDEFHERSIHADLALALLKQAGQAREDLRIVVMSATLDSGRVSEYLGGCPVIEIAARAHPVDVRYDPNLTVASAAREVLSQPGGHLLCFLPGAAEISQTAAELRNSALGEGVAVLPLHGSLPSSGQDRALAPSSARKIILATNIAETSVTVDGVTDVVDSGYHKVLRYDPRTGIDRLDLERIPADSATQRAGRSGRQGPGRVLRLWDPRERLYPHREPDILRIDLAAPFLQVIAWGGDPVMLDWFEAPPADQASAALELLERLGLIAGRRLTRLGEVSRHLPLHPRLACLLIAAGASARAAAVCAILSDRLVPASKNETTVSDILSQSDRITEASSFVQHAAREIQAVAHRLIKSRNPEQSDEELLRAIFAAYPDRVARRRAPGSERVLLSSGHGARLARSTSVREGEFLVAVEVIGARHGSLSEASVTSASLVRKEWLQPTDVRLAHVFDAGTGKVKAFEESRYGEIVLAERPAQPDPDQAAGLLVKALEESGLDAESRQLMQRAALAGISVDLDDARRQACAGRLSLPRFKVRDYLSFAEMRTINRVCPEELAVPSGRKIRLDYREDGSVRLAVKLQEMFGLAETPRVGLRQEPIVIELLAPNGRPVQTTRDLQSFWHATYQEVRKELRGRYPKHPWPEDPWTAPATARVKRRRGGLRGRLFFFLILIGASVSVLALDTVVRTESGLVRGMGTDVVVFKGIPYVAPPVGPLRWKAPQPAVPWQGTRDALKFCPTCPQPLLLPGVPPEQSEDCLGLNIWTPAKTLKDKLPVMVWIHGGGFLIGSASQASYNSELLAREGVVVVTINYRLGVLGFFAHPELSKESPQHVSGNYALLDQIAALKWVQRNIANFGGDPKRVTIFGESAGGASVFSLLACPLAKGLFSRAISQSGTWVFTPVRHLREARYSYESAEEAGAALGDLATLRSMSFQDLMRLKHAKPDRLFDFGYVSYRPIADGWVFPRDPSEVFERGDFVEVPLMAGTNAEESDLFMSMGLLAQIKTPADYLAWLTDRFGKEGAERIAQAYPAATDADVQKAKRQYITDFFFAAPTKAVALAVESKRPVYFYRFSRVNPIARAKNMGAHHAADIAYVFGTFDAPMTTAPGQSYEETDFKLGKAMRAAWVQFAKTGDPNGPGLAKWPRYTAKDEECLDFGDSVTAKSLPGASQIDVLISVFRQLRDAGKKTQLSRNQ